MPRGTASALLPHLCPHSSLIPLRLPSPLLLQVLLTSKETVRIILASDGLWDAVTTPKAVRAVRYMPVFSAASEVGRVCVSVCVCA